MMKALPKNISFGRFFTSLIIIIFLLGSGQNSTSFQILASNDSQESYRKAFEKMKESILFSTLYQPGEPFMDFTTIPTDLAVDHERNAYWIGFVELGGVFKSFFVKISPQGELIFEHSWRKAHFSHIQQDSQHNLWVLGYIECEDLIPINPWEKSTNNSTLLIQFSPEGKVLQITPWFSDASFIGFEIVDEKMHFFGSTTCPDFPQTHHMGDITDSYQNSFVTITDLKGNILYSVLIGGNNRTSPSAYSIAKDGSIVIGGFTRATNLPLKNAIKTEHQGKNRYTGFITKFNPDYSLSFLSYFGGTNLDAISFIALDSNQHIHMIGSTSSHDFPLIHPWRSILPTSRALTFYAILDENCSLLQSSIVSENYLYVSAFHIDDLNHIYISFFYCQFSEKAFHTYKIGSRSFQIWLPNFDPYFCFSVETLHAKHHMSTNQHRDIYVMGLTHMDRIVEVPLPLVRAHQSDLRGAGDAFLARIQLPPALAKPNKLLLQIGEEKATLMEHGKVTLLPPLEAPPMIVQGRTLIPLRVLAETMGMEVSWVPDGQYIWLDRDGVRLELQIGRDYAWKYALDAPEQREKLVMDVPPMIVNQRTLFPLRFVAENFGALVDWNGFEQRILVSWE